MLQINIIFKIVSMSDVFRLHKGKELEDWSATQEYGEFEIEGITDPSGESDNSEITSIPSTFARMDLVINAFKRIVLQKNIDGNTIHHKLVSEALDIGEIMFNIDHLSGKIKIKQWSPTADLAILKSGNAKHKLLGETYSLFLDQDKESFNFDKINRLYEIEYSEGPTNKKILGGTSPATLFYSSANDADFVDINFGNHKLFYRSEEESFIYPALYKRDPDFVKYLFGFFKEYDITKEFYKGYRNPLDYVKEYFNLNLDKLHDINKTLHTDLIQINSKFFNESYAELTTGKEGDIVEIIGCTLRKKKINTSSIEENSDFVIKSTKYQSVKPLVLQNNFTKKLHYTTGFWIPNTVVSYFPIDDSERFIDFRNRILPNLTTKYPWLTVSDFLEPYIQKLVYPINKKYFFNGNLSNANNGGYLLPVKPLFFDFFDEHELSKVHYDGKKWFEIIEEAGGGVTVKMRIPIKKENEYITFERTYSPIFSKEYLPEPDQSENQGLVIENEFSIGVFPAVQSLNGNLKTHYRVLLIDSNKGNLLKDKELKLKFFRTDNSLVEATEKIRSDKKEGDELATKYYVLNENFNFIQLTIDFSCGILLPKFKKYAPGHSNFTFAIDFGTTYTHIEQQVDGGVPFAFEIKKDDIQLVTLHDHNDEDLRGIAPELIDIIPQEFIPYELGDKSEYLMPQRTVIGFKHNLDFLKNTFALADLNIPFVYEKEPIYKNIITKTYLKWSDYVEGKQNILDYKSVYAFIDVILYMIRNKVLLNGGNIENTKIIWSYPSSMIPQRRDSLEQVWLELYSKYFSDYAKGKVFNLSESIAPFYYYKTRWQVKSGSKPALSIDIGGETTDVVIFKGNEPLSLTSFRYGANVLYGDGYGGSATNNGFVIKYKNYYQNLFESNNLGNLSQIFEDLLSKDESTNIIDFLFSLESNKKIVDQNMYSFNRKLSEDSDLKIVFLFYYASIIYHSAKLMIAEGYDVPGYLTFSGTASKLLNIIDKSSGLKRLEKFTSILFSKIYEIDDIEIKIRQDKNPKEITAKGSLYADSFEEIEGIKTILLGTGNNLIIPKEKLYYNQFIDDQETRAAVINEVKEFIELFFAIDKSYNYEKYFAINNSKINKYEEYLTDELDEFLILGLNNKKKELPEDNMIDVEIEETMFFYPLVGAINNLAFKIVSEKEK